MQTLLYDLRFAIRQLRKSPGFTAVVVLSLGLSVGANSTMFNLANAVLLKPLPYGHPEKLVTLVQSDERSAQDWISPADYLDWKSQNHVFDDMAACTYGGGGILEAGGPPQGAMGFKVTPNFFDLLQVKTTLGRTFLPEDGMAGGNQVVVLNYELWQRVFGSDPKVVGRILKINNKDFTVVGVLPKQFWFLFRQVKLWIPLPITKEMMGDRTNSSLYVVGRIMQPVSAQSAQAEMSGMERRLARQYPATNSNRRVSVIGLHDSFVQDGRMILIVLAGAVAMLLLIACANMANLLVARTSTRLGENAVRLALGAGRWQLVCQSLMESVLLASAGGLLGIGLAYWGNKLVLALLPSEYSWWLPTLDVDSLAIGSRVAGFTITLSIVTGIIAALLPLFRLLRLDFVELLKRKGAASRRGAGIRGRDALIVSELTLTLVLLVGAGLTLKNFARLHGMNLGYRRTDLLTLRFGPPSSYDDEHAVRLYQQAIDSVKTVPGVESVALINGLLSPPGYLDAPVSVEGHPVSSPNDSPLVLSRYVSQRYFHVVGIPLMRGRDFNDGDSRSALRVAIISQAMAHRLWPSEDPIGHRIKLHPLEGQEPWASVIGIAADANYYEGWSTPPGPTVYLPWSQYPQDNTTATMVLHTSSKSLQSGSELANALRSIDKSLLIPEPVTIEQMISDGTWQARFGMLILLIFASVAVFLAALGVYGLMSYVVTRRTDEIAVRMALGATRLQVLKLVLRQSVRLIVVGLVVGLGMSFAAGRTVASQLSQVAPWDPAILTAASMLLAAIGLLAGYIPARRAAKVDPMVALRYE